MSWTRTLTSEVEGEFRAAQRLRHGIGAREGDAPVPVERTSNVHSEERLARRRIVTPTDIP